MLRLSDSSNSGESWAGRGNSVPRATEEEGPPGTRNAGLLGKKYADFSLLPPFHLLLPPFGKTHWKLADKGV